MHINRKSRNKRIICLGQMLLIMLYPIVYWGTESYESTFIVFSLLGISGRVYLTINDIEIERTQKYAYDILAIIISVMFVLADYSHFVDNSVFSILKAGVALLVGFIIFEGIIFAANNILKEKQSNKHEEYSKKYILLIAFVLPSVVDNIYLKFCAYPGWIDSDTINQLGQMLSGKYNNHHPFWHTKIMEMIILPVYRLTGDGNSATYAFCVVQIVLMSLVFVYAIDTLACIGVSKTWIWIIIIGYTVSPYNVGMSAGVLKDSMFSISVSLTIVALIREINKLGNYRLCNDLLMILGLLGSCLLKTNGMFAMIFSVMLSWVIMGKKCKRIPSIMTTVVLFAFLLNKFYIGYSQIPQPDTVESLSIPLQQIARAASDCKEISISSESYLDEVVGYKKMGEAYVPNISDNVKNLIRKEGNQDYLRDNKADFFKVWLDIGIHHPFNYLKGWVDQTRGYWGPSYCFLGCQRGIRKETFGFMNLHNVTLDNDFVKVWNYWEKILLTNYIPGFEMLFSQGLRFWILVFCFMWSCFNNKNNAIVCTIPISIILTLLIATPVCAELRYSYPIYEVFFLIVVASSRTEKAERFK